MAEETTSIWGRIWDTVDNVIENGLPAYLDNEAASAAQQAAAQYAEKAAPSDNVEAISGGVFGVSVTPQNLMILGGVLIGGVVILKMIKG